MSTKFIYALTLTICGAVFSLLMFFTGLQTEKLATGQYVQYLGLVMMFVVLWLGRAEWRNTDPSRQMAEPYGRVVVLHATILVGAIPVVAFGEPAIGVFVLALFKTALELGLPQFQIGRRPTPDAA